MSRTLLAVRARMSRGGTWWGTREGGPGGQYRTWWGTTYVTMCKRNFEGGQIGLKPPLHLPC